MPSTRSTFHPVAPPAHPVGATPLPAVILDRCLSSPPPPGPAALPALPPRRLTGGGTRSGLLPPPGPVFVGRGVLPAADGQTCSGGYACLCVYVCDQVRGVDRLSFCLSCLLRPSVPALPRLGFLTGAGGLPRRLGFSCMCAARVPVAPAVGAVPLCLCLVPLWHRGRCDVSVVCWLYACTAAWSGYYLLWLV